MNKPSVLIIGFGVVGHNLYRELFQISPITKESPLIVHIYDKYKGLNNKGLDHYDLAFICVDTPATDDTTCDISEVANAITENDADIFVIKSTILPKQAQILSLIPDKHIVFSPEYYGATQHCNNYNFNFTILGGEKADCVKVIQILQKIYDASHQFRITDLKTACLAKYMENSYLAMKVSFCNQFYDIAEQEGVCYEELRELFVMDPRVDPSHTFVYRDTPYWDSHCLNKDVKAISYEYLADLLKGIVDYNDRRKSGTEEHDA